MVAGLLAAALQADGARRADAEGRLLHTLLAVAAELVLTARLHHEPAGGRRAAAGPQLAELVRGET